jgi:bacteriocin biosynthesis cyclodehydratase domain-containing protein
MYTLSGVTAAHLPRLRLAPGRTVLWRGNNSLQLGIDPRHGMVIDYLTPGQAEVLKRLDGRHSTDDLLAAAAAAGTDHIAALRLLNELADAGIIEPADGSAAAPSVLAPDVASWKLRTGRRHAEVLDRRAAATVRVHGNGRIAIGVAMVLAAAGVDHVTVAATGRVGSEDVGTGYLPGDVGRPRQEAAEAAVRRSRTVPAADHAAGPPEVVVLADAAVWDPHFALRLLHHRVPHLAVHAREASVVIGPLVLPGRTGCLRCADLHRADDDPCWPRLAAQLANRPPVPELASAHAAAAMAAEQVLALLIGPGEPPDAPPTAGTTFELDPLQGRLVRRRWPAHPDCQCGAAAHP